MIPYGIQNFKRNALLSGRSEARTISNNVLPECMHETEQDNSGHVLVHSHLSKRFSQSRLMPSEDHPFSAPGAEFSHPAGASQQNAVALHVLSPTSI